MVISNKEIRRIPVSVLKTPLPLSCHLQAMHKLSFLCCLKSVFLVYFTEVTLKHVGVAVPNAHLSAEGGGAQGGGEDKQPPSPSLLLFVNATANV